MLQFSKYNISVKNGNKHLIFNTISGAIISISKELYHLLKKPYCDESVSIPDNYKKTLLENKIISDDEYELNKILKKREAISNDSSTLSLMIHPTLNCNIECHYCYQKSYPKKDMTLSTANNIILFISKYAKEHDLKHLRLTWSGGEPLLAIDKIEYILHEIKSILPAKTILSMNMISNGTLLSDKTVKILDKLGIHSLQITVDGLNEKHNKRRSIGEYDSFSDVIKNIENVLENYPSIYVNIRVNIDKNNINDYSTLHDYFSNKYQEKNYSIYPECVIYQDNIGNIIEESSAVGMTKKDKIDFFINLSKNNRLKLEYLLSHPERFCMMKTRYSFAVGADSKVYNCELMVGNERKAYNNIDDYQQLLDAVRSHKKIAGRRKACETCSLLPLCNYGCLSDKSKKDKYSHCHLIKGYEKKFILLYADQINNNLF